MYRGHLIQRQQTNSPVCTAYDSQGTSWENLERDRKRKTSFFPFVWTHPYETWYIVGQSSDLRGLKVDFPPESNDVCCLKAVTDL